MASFLDTPWTTLLYPLATVYIGVEVAFFVAFHKYFVPKANELQKEPIPYRDYGRDRCKLLTRIIKRIEGTCKIMNKDTKATILQFLSEWFDSRTATNNINTTIDNDMNNCGTVNGKLLLNENKKQDGSPRLLPTTPSSSPEHSDNDDDGDDTDDTNWDVDNSNPIPISNGIYLHRDAVDEFFAWAFFGKHFDNLLPWECLELDRIYAILKQRHQIDFPKKKTSGNGSNDKNKNKIMIMDDNTKNTTNFFPNSRPRLLTLEPLNSIYRPLLVYMLVYGMKLTGGCYLSSIGFRRFVTRSGLVAWYRPAKKSTGGTLLPIAFFHGIAPGGVVPYLPMILHGLAPEQDRPIFLFENRAISCSIGWEPLTEEQTVDGVVETLKHFEHYHSPISLVGHSFGSCSIAWLVGSKSLPNVKQVVLIDPVAILLSEPDVMANFLYSEQLDKIRMVASSELFTEYYLRRHFAWYNSELWLEDVQCSLIVCLSEHDSIVNAEKVKREIERHSTEGGRHHHNHSDQNPDGVHHRHSHQHQHQHHGQRRHRHRHHHRRRPATDVIYWTGVGHAACVTAPPMWGQIKDLMTKQEQNIIHDNKQQ